MAITPLDKIDFSQIALAPKGEKKPQFTVIYGKGGLGKTTLACYSPSPVIIPIGYETGHERHAYYGIPTFANPGIPPVDFVFGSIARLLKTEHSRKTVILDNIGTFREIAAADVAKDNKDTDLKAFGRGVALEYKYYLELFYGISKLLDKGLNVILIGHEVSYNINLESGDYFSRIHINAPAGDNTNVRALLESKPHNVFYLKGEMPTTTVKGVGGKLKQVATSGDMSRVIYTKPTGLFFAKSRESIDHFYEIEPTQDDEALFKSLSNQSMIKFWEDVYK